MPKALEFAVDEVRRLPRARQAEAAEMLEQLVRAASGVHALSDEELALLVEAEAEVKCGE